MKIGLIINPVAGLGGSVGLKGTDLMVEEALRRGAIPQAFYRAEVALAQLLPVQSQVELFTGSGEMGGDLAEKLGFSSEIRPTAPMTTSQTTQNLASWMVSQGVELILFAGGDGTARDLCQVLPTGQVVLGIPAGVKIHSPVYARSPQSAGVLARKYVEHQVKSTQEVEVLDIHEGLYRQEIINTQLFGYLTIPLEKNFTQNRKCASPLSQRATMNAIAAEIVEQMEEDCYYIMGAGTTTRAVMERMGLENTLIGVDLVQNGQLVEKDTYGRQLLTTIGQESAKLVVTITGGQGFLFGRGNQQITPEVIEKVGKNNIIILATQEKLLELRGQPLLVDTGSQGLDRSLCGYYQVVTSYGQRTVAQVACG